MSYFFHILYLYRVPWYSRRDGSLSLQFCLVVVAAMYITSCIKWLVILIGVGLWSMAYSIGMFFHSGCVKVPANTSVAGRGLVGCCVLVVWQIDSTFLVFAMLLLILLLM